MNNAPCKKNGIPCPKRELGCHSKCHEYLSYAKERAEISQQQKYRNERDTITIDGINKAKRYKHYKKRR